ncbi:MAG: hypothetical protein ACI3XX_03890 [Eubacteriales bacterium]
MDEKKFEYSYTAPTERERKEVESLKKKYAPRIERTDKMSELRELDKKVQSPPRIWALILGIVGTLIFGTGLTMILEWDVFVWGAVIAAVGLVPVALAYPVYKWKLQKLSDQYREQILALSEEILHENKDA